MIISKVNLSGICNEKLQSQNNRVVFKEKNILNYSNSFEKKISFNGLSKALLDPKEGSLKTPTGIKYYLATATGNQILKPGESYKINPLVFTESQRLTYNQVLYFKPITDKARNTVSNIYYSEEIPSYGWLCKSTIESEKVRANEIEKYVDKYYKDKVRDIIIIGMGGNIGTMKLAATSVAKKCEGNTITAKNNVKFHFMDTMEPTRINELKDLINNKPESTLICLVSQSGSTFETIAINLLLQDIKQLPKENIIPMIGTKDSAIGAMANSLGYQPQPNKMADELFDIPNWSRTGGRWTGITAEPALMIALGGGKPVKWFEGYQKTIEHFINKDFDKNPVLQAATLDIAYSANGFDDFCTFAYGDKLGGAGHALTQNVNESTPCLKHNKKDKQEDFGRGLVHRFFVCPAAQHADMATFTDFATHRVKLRILEVDNDEASENSISFNKLFKNIIPEQFKSRAGNMEGLKPSQLMKTMAAATAYDIWNRGRPVEMVSIPKINEETMASLLADQYLRTMVWGYANGVDVVREMSFPDYKDAFKTAIKEVDPEKLGNGASDIFFNYAKKSGQVFYE